jgi:hypothetical protein
MKPSILFIFILAFFVGCSNAGKNDKANTALVENYIQAVENLDFDAMTEYLDDSYQGLGPSHDDSTTKTEAVENWKYNVENLYESIKYRDSRTIAITENEGVNKGEWVLNWAELEIKYKDSNTPIVIYANTIYLVENGKIVKSHTFYNEADVLEQMGFLFVNPDDL